MVLSRLYDPFQSFVVIAPDFPIGKLARTTHGRSKRFTPLSPELNMSRVVAILSLVACMAASPSTVFADDLPLPKAAFPSNERTSRYQDVHTQSEPDKCCNFLCDIYLLNCTGTKIKVWVRATLLCFPGFVVDIPGECFGTYLVASPCCHPWHIWFENIKIGVWDGETCETICVPFKSCCCKRRYVVEYDDHHHIHVKEK
jgi:hypothetical protein